MKAFRKMRENRKRHSSRNSSNQSLGPSEAGSSSVSYEGRGFPGFGRTGRILVVPHGGAESTMDDLTETSSLAPHLEEDDLLKSLNRSHDQPLAMELYRGSKTPKSLPDSLQLWLQSAEALVRSPEMQALLGSSQGVIHSAAVTSRDAAMSAGGAVVKVALLPVSIPLHVAATTTGFAVGVAGNAIQVITGGGQPSGGEPTSPDSPIDGLIHGVANAVPFLFHSAGNIANGIGSLAGHIVAPVLGWDHGQDSGEKEAQSSKHRAYATCSGESSAERQNFLDRMRLDFQLPKEEDDVSESDPYSRATASDVSKYLMRVDDLLVIVYADPAASSAGTSKRAIVIDLDKDFSEESITAEALGQLIHRGLDMASSNGSAHFLVSGYKASPTLKIDWKPEGATNRLLHKLGQRSVNEKYDILRHNVLVWSGNYLGPKYYGSENPVFLARGVVRRSPREFCNLLWDSDRAGEYNNFSLGRTDVIILENGIAEGGDTGSKVIKSETKVPFTGLTVTLSALMHAKRIQEGDSEVFVIVSRSLSSGMAGCHVDTSKRVEGGNKNEIILGVNIMRPVPGHPELTDLMSLSQVSSSMVPQFLAFRIGMMGVEDFFANVRKE